MSGFDWPGLLRAAVRGAGLTPAQFWELTPAELLVVLGLDAGGAPMTRAGLEALAAAWPDGAQQDGAQADVAGPSGAGPDRAGPSGAGAEATAGAEVRAGTGGGPADEVNGGGDGRDRGSEPGGGGAGRDPARRGGADGGL